MANPDYQSNMQSVGTTATKYIDGSFTTGDVEVVLSLGATSGDCRLAFSSTQAPTGVLLGELSSPGFPLRFVLAMGEDLWMITDSGTATVNLLVTKKA
jgi:hypothetical protein